MWVFIHYKGGTRMESYVPLHLHTHRDSILDSMVHIENKNKNECSLLMKRAIEYDMPAMAITGHGYMNGALEHYKN